MKTISISHGDTDGFETIHISNASLMLAYIPALGGKITSLRDLPGGREWLWRNPRMPYRRVPYSSSYVMTADTGGWDECFPTVAACDYPSPPWQGTAIQDHGELWSQEAVTNITDSPEGLALSSRWVGHRLPYLIERTIMVSADSPRLDFHYAVTNTSDTPVQWIWSAHPLLAVEPGMQLFVPSSARFNLGGTFPADLLPQSNGRAFPPPVRQMDLTTLPPTDAGIAMKLWSDPLAEGWATLHASDGELRLTWDTSQLPRLGIWMNLGAWAGDGGAPYYNLGLEPCIGAQDSLAEAVTQYHLFETLAPHGTRSWDLAVELRRA